LDALGPILDHLKHTFSITELYPPQEEALELSGDGSSLVLALATASGKSLVAYANLLRTVKEGSKGLYIVPLRALAAEKYRELKHIAATWDRPCRVGLAMGDYDTPAGALGHYDILVATSEKVDSLLRSTPAWLKGLGCVVADEVHLLHDRKRGPALEVSLARLRAGRSDLQILALSATVANSRELADWLEAKHLASDWRPVQLKRALCVGKLLEFEGESPRLLEGREALPSLVGETLQRGGQLLLFVSSRRNAEAAARNLAATVAPHLDEDTSKALDTYARDLETSQAEATLTTATVAGCLRAGIAFHHAGLAGPHRETLEAAFRARHLRVIVATPTLAAGVNLPAQRVIVRDLFRYDFEMGGSSPLPVLEVHQMMGRAGRPGFDDLGEAVLMVKDPGQAEQMGHLYLHGRPEPLVSQLGSQAALRTHLLAAIAAGHCGNREEVESFLAATFYGHSEDLWRLHARIEKVLDFLEEKELIQRTGGPPPSGEFASGAELARDMTGESLMATDFGAKVSQLYLDPLGGVGLREALGRADPELARGDRAREGLELGLLHALCATPDMTSLYARPKERYDLLEQLYEKEEYLLVEAPADEQGLEEHLGHFKTAMLLRAWANEASEDHLVESFGVGPGDIHHLTTTAQWLLYSFTQLARLELPELAPLLDSLHRRVAFGVKEELLDLLTLEGIGRVRARTLHRNGFTEPRELARAMPEELAKLPGIGPILAQSIVKQTAG